MIFGLPTYDHSNQKASVFTCRDETRRDEIPVADRTTDSSVANSSRILGLFAKAWDAGKVKTRLAKTLGNEAAAEIYQSLLAVNLIGFAASGDQRVVAYSPADDATRDRFDSFISDLKPQPAWKLTAQSEGDLGTRMGSFFQQQFEIHGQGARVVLIGSDALGLTSRLMENAFELLSSHDVVYGPSTDGGYYLVGLSDMNVQVFQDIDWSTEKVLDQSLQKCESCGLSVAQLEPLTDIDNEDDLRQEIQALRSVDEQQLESFQQNFLDEVTRILGETWL